MLPLPQAAIDESDLRRLSDWVELNCLLDGEFRKPSAADTLVQTLDASGPRQDFGGIDDPSRDSESLSSGDDVERLVSEIWGVLSDRGAAMGDGYPFALTSQAVSLRRPTWPQNLGYTTLLLADLGSEYKGVRVGYDAMVGDTAFPALFEKIVEAALRARFRGTTIHYGFPHDAAWPARAEHRVRHLGDLLDLKTHDLSGLIVPADKDLGLDVASRLSFGDEWPGTLVVLAQCATGANWREKRGEPSLMLWKDCFRWGAGLVRAVAVPWRLANPQTEYERAYHHFDGALILDFPRICSTDFEHLIDPALRPALEGWCRARIDEIRAIATPASAV